MQDVINKDSRHQDNEAPHKIKQREMKRLTTEVKQQHPTKELLFLLFS
jgi:hypothetical protein